VRAYLLGTLDPAEAAAFEDRYFGDDAVFAELKVTENRLIADFLDGRLPPQERKLFEARYLRVPELKRRLDEVSAGRRPVARFQFRPLWMAAAAALVLVTAGAVWYSQQPGAPSSVLTARSVSPAEVQPLAHSLVPFLAKGAGGAANQFATPPPRTPVRLNLELPGRTGAGAVEASVSLYRLDAAGARQPVWRGTAPARSEPAAADQEPSILLPPGLLVRADYLLEVKTPDGNLIGSYFFRVTEAR
jgi:anti-sigma factor RsiW